MKSFLTTERSALSTSQLHKRGRRAEHEDELRMQLARLGMFQGHEMMDHPMAALYAISFHTDGGCARATTDLLQKHLKPSDDNSSFSQAMASKTAFPLWHPDFPRHFVIVIDAKQGAHEPSEVTRAVSAVQKAAATAVGSDGIVKVSAVVLNSGSGGADSAGAQVSWARFRHSSLSCPGRHRVVACAGESLQQIDMKRDEGVSASVRGGWLTQRNLDDVMAVVNAFLRAHCSTLRASSFGHVAIRACLPAYSSADVYIPEHSSDMGSASTASEDQEMTSCCCRRDAVPPHGAAHERAARCSCAAPRHVPPFAHQSHRLLITHVLTVTERPHLRPR